jgi:phage-related protein (TIGR01555 family)
MENMSALREPYVNNKGETVAYITRRKSADERTLDAFTNQLARIGFGTPSLLESTSYPLTRLTRNYILMQSLYRSHWIARKIVDAPAEDMLKNWIELVTEFAPDQLTQFDRVVRTTGTRSSIMKAVKWGRLFGGAGAIIMIKGHENRMEEPLEIEAVDLDSYRGLWVFDRWNGIVPDTRICDDIDTPIDFGLPEFYQCTTQNGKTFKVHCSRVLRFIGRDIPSWEKQAEQYWGVAEYEVIFDELKKRDNTSWNIASLIFRANIFEMKHKDLAQMLSGISGPGSTAAMQRLYGALQAQNHLMSNQGIFISPEEGGMSQHSYSFSGVADVYELFKEDMCGASEIPYPRLFGRTAGGLTTTGEGDMQTYYDHIAQLQGDDLQPQLDKVIPVIAMSTWGTVPEDLDYRFAPVRTLNDQQRSDLGAKRTTAVQQIFDSGIVGRQTALKELKEQSAVDGFWTNITDEMIEEADDEVVSPVEAMEMENQPPAGGSSENNA